MQFSEDSLCSVRPGSGEPPSQLSVRSEASARGIGKALLCTIPVPAQTSGVDAPTKSPRYGENDGFRIREPLRRLPPSRSETCRRFPVKLNQTTACTLWALGGIPMRLSLTTIRRPALILLVQGTPNWTTFDLL